MAHSKKPGKPQKLLLAEDPERRPEFFDTDEQYLDTYNPAQGMRDSQYENLVGPRKPKRAVQQHSVFEQDEKYRGKRAERQPAGQVDPDPEEQNQEDPADLAQAYRSIKAARKVDSRLLEEKIRELREEDEQQIVEAPQETSVSAQHLSNQLGISHGLVEIRYNFEKTFQEIKKFPFQNAPWSRQLNAQALETRRAVLESISSLRDIQRQLFAKATGKELPEMEEAEQGILVTYKHYRQETRELSRFLEESLVRWSNKTSLLGQVGSSGYSSLLMQTPVGQAQKVLTSLDKILPKARLKRGVFRTLFSPAEEIRNSQNEQVFDDFELFHQVARSYEEHLDGDSGRFREQRARAQHRDVDRKATKNRKLRFNVEPKLINFMASQDNPYLLQARDEILKNIFNSGPKEEAVDFIDL